MLKCPMAENRRAREGKKENERKLEGAGMYSGSAGFNLSGLNLLRRVPPPNIALGPAFPQLLLMDIVNPDLPA